MQGRVLAVISLNPKEIQPVLNAGLPAQISLQHPFISVEGTIPESMTIKFNQILDWVALQATQTKRIS
jgi:hypothetical protein